MKHRKNSKLMVDYFGNSSQIETFFDYSYNNPDNYRERSKELLSRNFQRGVITERLLAFNQKYNCSSETIVNIEKLSSPSSVAIVGGQQAGVLTGPLYTIHKIITIVQLAKEQEEKLGIPVVPIFWIAGEDHDFDEVNHIHSVKSTKLLKRKVEQQNDLKQSVSNINIDKEALTKFIAEVLRDNKETEHTVKLNELIQKSLEKSENYTDFFSFLIHQLCKNSGIVLLDAHDPELRKVEVPFFKQLIKKNDSVNDLFLKGANDLNNEGYGEPIERSENNAHLFYHFHGTRLLLQKSKDGTFVDKKGLVNFSESELLARLDKEPHLFSNNVVTRPLMQEFLLPVLAFVAGPGEVAYWATLKELFHLFNYKLPPVIPRHSLTIIEPKVEKVLLEFDLLAQDVVTEGTTSVRNGLSFWDEKEQIGETLHDVLSNVEKIHQPLKDLVTIYDKGLEGMAHKNELMIKKEITFLARRIEKSVRQKYEHELLKFDFIDSNLLPNGGLQERSLNIVKYVNEYGFDFVGKLLELPLWINDKHKLIFLK